MVVDETTGGTVVPNGSLGFRWTEPGKGKWNLDLGGTVPLLSLSDVRGGEAAEVLLPRFDTEGGEHGQGRGESLACGVPALRLPDGRLVATVFDLLLYLPTYLKTWYDLGATDAGTKAAGFSLVTVLFRPFGGWLSDRVHPAVVTSWSLGIVGLFAVVQSFDPELDPVGTICLLVMAAGLGAASGAVFALVAQVTPQSQVGSVTGIVGAMGGLGGFVPPLVMGAIYSAKGSYSIGFMLLSDLALAGCVYAFGRMRTAGRARG